MNTVKDLKKYLETIPDDTELEVVRHTASSYDAWGGEEGLEIDVNTSYDKQLKLLTFGVYDC